MLRVRLLGKLSLERDGQPLPAPRGQKTWAVLGRLVRSQEPVPRRTLVEELFSDADDPMGALRWSLAELRRRTGLSQAFRGDPLVANLGQDATTDISELTRSGIPDEIPEGHFLDGVDVKGSPGFQSWLLIERHRVDGEVLSALRQAALRALSGGRFDRAVALAGAMVRRVPFEEGPHVLLVKALASSGDVAAALRQARVSEAMFTAEFGLTATPAIQAAARPLVTASAPGVSARASAVALCEAGLTAVSAGAPDAGIECLRTASSAAERSGDKELLARCLTELGTALVHSIGGYDDEGAIVLAAAVATATAAGAERIAAKALSELAYVDILAGRRVSAAQYLQKAHDAAADDPALTAALTGFEAMNLSDWGRLDESMERFRTAVELSRSAGATRREAWVFGLGARTLFLQGRLDETVEWARRSCELAAHERWTAFRPWPEAWLVHGRLARGEDPRQLRENAEATFALARQLRDPCWEGLAAKTIGLTYLRESVPEPALEWMENANVLCNRVTDAYAWLRAEIYLAEAQAALVCGDSARAESVARLAAAMAAKGSMEDLVGRALGLLASISGARPPRASALP